MVSTSHLEDGDEEMVQSDTYRWIKHLNTLWDIRSNPHVLSIMMSMIGRGNSSLGQASFRSEKSMQIRIFPLFGNEDDIGYPMRMLLLPNEARVYEFFDF